MQPEIRDLLQKLSDAPEIPEQPRISEASRRKADAIAARVEQENPTAPIMPKPVYDTPPQHKKIKTKPVPISHFSETPSQNPVVRMHDRLLEDAIPPPDIERRPTKMIEPKTEKSSPRKTKISQPKIKKNFQIQINEDLPPDIPRDTSVADRIRREQLEAVLASAPPRTPEQIRKEKIRIQAAKIREQMQQQTIIQNQPPPPAPPPPEPEEIIPAWEERLSAFSKASEQENHDQLALLKNPGKLHRTLSDLPEIIPEEDTSLIEISEKLQDVSMDLSEPIAPEKPVKKSAPRKKKRKKKKKHSFFQKIILFWKRLLKMLHGKKYKKSRKSKKKKVRHASKMQADESDHPAVYQPPPKITDVIMTPAQEQPVMNLAFTPSVMLQTAPAQPVKIKKKAIVRKRIKN